MRCRLRAGVLSVVAVFLTSACVAPPGAGVPMPGSAQVLPADARALRYGATAPEVFDNSQLRDKLHGLFGADWTSGAGRAFGAPAFFPPAASIRMVRMADRDYIAISGCVTSACESYRGLLLIGQDERLLARLDEGGFSRYYEYGPGATGGVQARTTLDGAWLAIQGVARG
jgi:hypothetical protein